MLIYLLLLSILLICGISYVLSKRDVLAPPVVFSGVFIISTLIAIPNINLWNFHMGERTFLVLLLGISFFCIGYYVVYFLKEPKKDKNVSNIIVDNYEIKNYKLVIFFFIQMLTMYLLYQSISDVASNMGGGDSLTEKIYLYRTNEILYNNENGDTSFLVKNLLLFCKSVTYFLIYRFHMEYFKNNIINKKYLFIILITCLINLLKGNRGDSVEFLVAFFVMGYIFWLSKNKWKKFLSIKKIIYILGGISLFLILFFSLGLIILGRDAQLGDLDIISGIWLQVSMYIGAPLKLLDLYMYTDFSTEKIPLGIVSFRAIYGFLGRNLDIVNWQLPLLFGSEFRNDNGASLGNVYTTFRPYLMDFGYLGVVILPFIMGAIYAIIYSSIKYIKNNNRGININIIIYSYLYLCIVKAFFIEWFYKYFFNLDLIKIIIFLKIIEYIFLNKKYERIK